jgi:lysophospholipase L1-like esterase
MLGDSFTAAFNVAEQDTFSQKLEEMLQNHIPNRNIQVINAGVASYSPLLEYLFLREKGLKLEPDLVILNFDLSDIFDEARYWHIADLEVDGTIVRVNEIPELIPLNRWVNYQISKHSFLYTRYIRRYLTHSKISFTENVNSYSKQNEKSFETDFLAPLRENANYNPTLYWHWPKISLRQIKKLADEQQIPLIITTYPYPPQVNGTEWPEREMAKFELGKIYPPTNMENLEAIAKNMDIPIINSLEAFQESNKTPLYFQRDFHFSPNGHQVFAEEIFDFLLSNAEKYNLINPSN